MHHHNLQAYTYQLAEHWFKVNIVGRKIVAPMAVINTYYKMKG